MKYLRLIQFIVCVSIINERLEHLDNLIVSIKNKLAKTDGRPNIYLTSTNTQMYLTIENYRELYGKIWRLHVMVNEYFGLTILLNTISAFITGGYNIYITIIANARNMSLVALADPFQSMGHIFIVYIVIVHTCCTSDKLVMKILIWIFYIFPQAIIFIPCPILSRFSLPCMKKASNIYQHLNQITLGISYLQIKEFTMQINYHQRFVYSACNFFFIDYRLLFSVNDKCITLAI